MRSFAKAISISVLGLLPGLVQAQDRASVLILDASGSMWTQLADGTSRIEVARDVLADFLSARDPAEPLGVIAYGHNRKGDCSDIEVLATVGPHDAAALGAGLRTLNPRGKTPLADALRLAATQIPSTSVTADIVLVTDGLETCGGDVCAVADELAGGGIPVRAHVVGFGLSEQEIAQVACIADTTGGLLLATQSGAELADALIRTTAPVITDDVPSGEAQLNLTIRADIAGRPDSVQFSAENTATAETFALGTLDFAQAGALPITLVAGDYRFIADAGDLGRGEVSLSVVAGDNRTIYVPFQGLLPSLNMPPPTGAFRMGNDALLPYTVVQEGLATGGGDFVFSVLPLDATSTYDRRIDYATQSSTLGSYVGRFRSPETAGDYLLVFSRNGDVPIDEVMKRFVVTFQERPEVTLTAPPAVEQDAAVPVTIAGGMGSSDRIEIWKDGALYSWDQSIYLQDFFDNRYGPAKPLIAPTEPGNYEIVYVFSNLDDEVKVAARVPLIVGSVPDFDEEALLTDGAGATQIAQACDDNTGCAMGEDPPVPLSGVMQVVIAAQGVQGQAVDWTLVPSGRDGASVIASGGAVAGPWTTVLTEGQWGVNGVADGATFFGEITVSDTTPVSFTIPRVMAIDSTPQSAVDIGFSCTESLQCTLDDPHVQIVGIVMAGWSTDVPTREGYVAGGDRGLVRLSFFGPKSPKDTIVLNPRQWVDQNGPCLDVQPGLLCYFEPASADTLAALEMLKITLRDTAPRNLPTPAEALATVVSDLSQDDPAAAAALEGLLGVAQGGAGEATAFGELIGALATGGLEGASEQARIFQQCPPDVACVFAQPDVQIAGVMPRGWSVDVMTTDADGRVRVWFTDTDPAGNQKRIGLNQTGGESCRDISVGRLCEFTPYIATAEIDLISGTLLQGDMADVLAIIDAKVAPPDPVTDPMALDQLLQQLEGN